MSKIRLFSVSRYVQAALAGAEYERDEDGVVVVSVPGMSGAFSQGETFEEARENLRDAIEGNVALALQLGWPIPQLAGVLIEEQDVPTYAA